MNCCDKQCNYKELNGGDEISDFYFCKYIGVTVDRGNEECLVDRFEREVYQETIKRFKKLKENNKNNKIIELYDIAIDTLKKQIPIKVRNPIDANGQYNKLVTYCYSCGKNVRDMKYCYNCGQRLDWEI